MGPYLICNSYINSREVSLKHINIFILINSRYILHHLLDSENLKCQHNESEDLCTSLFPTCWLLNYLEHMHYLIGKGELCKNWWSVLALIMLLFIVPLFYQLQIGGKIFTKRNAEFCVKLSGITPYQRKYCFKILGNVQEYTSVLMFYL